jgi:Glyoxalase/Bleomycin resistance protein/Dioxygenase superfamily
MKTVSALEIVQNAYVVANLEDGCERLHSLLGIGPFVGGNEFELSNHVYRGRPADPVRVRIAFVQSGGLNLELVELVSTSASAFHDMFAIGKEGLHHQAIFCDDYEARRDAFVAQGFPVASEFTVPWGAKICYVDARSKLGHMIELYPQDAVLHDLYRQAKEAARVWDGTDLIVPWNVGA